MPAHFQDEDEDTIKDEERALYEKHPIVGADMLKGIRLINPLVPQVVAQHHERRSRHGFPYKLGPGAISPVSELIGMTDTFNQLIKKSAKDSSLDPVIEMEKKYFDNFSFQVIESFRKIFPSSPSGISRRSA
jgi:HD-GYP domain-containing protein (c-di-GMP phosphodiesterase class II)